MQPLFVFSEKQRIAAVFPLFCNLYVYFAAITSGVVSIYRD